MTLSIKDMQLADFNPEDFKTAVGNTWNRYVGIIDLTGESFNADDAKVDSPLDVFIIAPDYREGGIVNAGRRRLSDLDITFKIINLALPDIATRITMEMETPYLREAIATNFDAFRPAIPTPKPTDLTYDKTVFVSITGLECNSRSKVVATNFINAQTDIKAEKITVGCKASEWATDITQKNVLAEFTIVSQAIASTQKKLLEYLADMALDDIGNVENKFCAQAVTDGVFFTVPTCIQSMDVKCLAFDPCNKRFDLPDATNIVTFEPEPTGITYVIGTEIVEAVEAGSQADLLGVEQGWRVMAISGKKVPRINVEANMREAMNAGTPFDVVFVHATDEPTSEPTVGGNNGHQNTDTLNVGDGKFVQETEPQPAPLEETTTAEDFPVAVLAGSVAGGVVLFLICAGYAYRKRKSASTTENALATSMSDIARAQKRQSEIEQEMMEFSYLDGDRYEGAGERGEPSTPSVDIKEKLRKEMLKKQRRKERNKLRKRMMAAAREAQEKKEQEAKEQEGELDEMTCSICLDRIEGTYQVTPCDHQYHMECLKEWLENADSCPACRADVRIEYCKTHRTDHKAWKSRSSGVQRYQAIGVKAPRQQYVIESSSDSSASKDITRHVKHEPRPPDMIDAAINRIRNSRKLVRRSGSLPRLERRKRSRHSQSISLEEQVDIPQAPPFQQIVNSIPPNAPASYRHSMVALHLNQRPQARNLNSQPGRGRPGSPAAAQDGGYVRPRHERSRSHIINGVARPRLSERYGNRYL